MADTEQRPTGPHPPVQNGTRATLNKLVWVAGLLIAGGAAFQVVESCIHRGAPLMGLQTVEAAQEAETKNTNEHQVIYDQLHTQKREQRIMRYKMDDVDEAVLEVLESRSPARAKDLKRKRERKWRERRARDELLEED